MEIIFTESLAHLCGVNVAETFIDVLLKHCILLMNAAIVLTKFHCLNLQHHHIANFILAVQLQINYTKEVLNLET